MSEKKQALTKNKISREAAEDNLDILLNYYDIDVDDFTEELQATISATLPRLTKHIMKGRIEIGLDDNESITIKQHLQSPVGDDKLFEYVEISGRNKTQMKDKDDSYKKIYTLLGSLSGHGAKVITALKGVDMSAAECVGMILLQV